MKKVKQFDNEDRNRYYGLRVGDTVSISFGKKQVCEVIGYGVMDNNSVRVKYPDGSKDYTTAEHCDIITKVEDKIGIEIKYSCVCNTIEEIDLFINFIAEMKKLKEKNITETVDAHV